MARSRLLDILLASSSIRITSAPEIDHGAVGDVESFPFLAIIGQEEMKTALVLSLINPRVGGVLLIGARGTAKTTAVRGLVDLLPNITRSLCVNGCTEQLLDEKGMDALCPDCLQKTGYGEPLTIAERMRVVELPLNAGMDDVVGGINERIALEQQRVRLQRGILSFADNQILYIDEVNMLSDPIANAILDAAAQGYYTVRRGPLKQSYRSRFLLVGSMNPEEGQLRPQFMDRFGLRAVARGLRDAETRYRAYEQVAAYQRDPEALAASYSAATIALGEEIQEARSLLPSVTVSPAAREAGIALILGLGIDSIRAEITLFEAARAHAAAAQRQEALIEDVEAIALLALRLRTSPDLATFVEKQDAEDARIQKLIANDDR